MNDKSISRRFVRLFRLPTDTRYTFPFWVGFFVGILYYFPFFPVLLLSLYTAHLACIDYIRTFPLSMRERQLRLLLYPLPIFLCFTVLYLWYYRQTAGLPLAILAHLLLFYLLFLLLSPLSMLRGKRFFKLSVLLSLAHLPLFRLIQGAAAQGNLPPYLIGSAIALCLLLPYFLFFSKRAYQSGARFQHLPELKPLPPAQARTALSPAVGVPLALGLVLLVAVLVFYLLGAF